MRTIRLQKEIEAGDQLTVDYWPAAVQRDDGTVINNITATSAIPGSPEVGVVFTAPKSGRVGIAVCAGMIEQAAGNRIFTSYRLFTGTSSSGTLVKGEEAVTGPSTSGNSVASREQLLGSLGMWEGLTPGGTYYCQFVYWTEGGTTNDITRRRIIVFPLA